MGAIREFASSTPLFRSRHPRRKAVRRAEEAISSGYRHGELIRFSDIYPNQ